MLWTKPLNLFYLTKIRQQTIEGGAIIVFTKLGAGSGGSMGGECDGAWVDAVFVFSATLASTNFVLCDGVDGAIVVVVVTAVATAVGESAWAADCSVLLGEAASRFDEFNWKNLQFWNVYSRILFEILD